MEPDLREKLIQEIQRIPENRLLELLDVLHYFRVGLETEFHPSGNVPFRSPSPRLANQGATLQGDDMAPAINPEDWEKLIGGAT